MATSKAGPQGRELKLGSGKGCFLSPAATSSEELDPQPGVGADVGSISGPLPAPGCPGPSAAQCPNTGCHMWVCTGS